MLFGALSLLIVIIPFAVQRAFPPVCDITFGSCASSVSTSSVLYLTVFFGVTPEDVLTDVTAKCLFCNMLYDCSAFPDMQDNCITPCASLP